MISWGILRCGTRVGYDASIVLFNCTSNQIVTMFSLTHRQFTVSRVAAAIFSTSRWCLMFWIGAAQAHDFWIEAEPFRPAVGEKVSVHLYVGMDFKGDSAPYIPERYERYVSTQGEKPVSGVLGDETGTVITPAAGLYIIGLHTKPADVTFDTAEEFEKYLLKEGLERNLALHNRRKQLGKAIHETYFRCAKSLIAVGNPRDGADKILGFPLELIAETNPYRTPALRLRLLYHGKPLSGALVLAFNKAEPLAKLKARTDDAGRVEFKLPKRGVWLVTSVHMIPAPLLSGYDWKSLWASLSFELP